jgi:hypothetical protein
MFMPARGLQSRHDLRRGVDAELGSRLGEHSFESHHWTDQGIESVNDLELRSMGAGRPSLGPFQDI